MELLTQRSRLFFTEINISSAVEIQRKGTANVPYRTVKRRKQCVRIATHADTRKGCRAIGGANAVC
jgi:hypothetical protein